MVVFSIFKAFFENAESDHFEMDRNNRVYFMSKRQAHTVTPSNPDVSCFLRKHKSRLSAKKTRKTTSSAMF